MPVTSNKNNGEKSSKNPIAPCIYKRLIFFTIYIFFISNPTFHHGVLETEAEPLSMWDKILNALTVLRKLKIYKSNVSVFIRIILFYL